MHTSMLACRAIIYSLLDSKFVESGDDIGYVDLDIWMLVMVGEYCKWFVGYSVCANCIVVAV